MRDAVCRELGSVVFPSSRTSAHVGSFGPTILLNWPRPSGCRSIARIRPAEVSPRSRGLQNHDEEASGACAFLELACTVVTHKSSDSILVPRSASIRTAGEVVFTDRVNLDETGNSVHDHEMH